MLMVKKKAYFVVVRRIISSSNNPHRKTRRERSVEPLPCIALKNKNFFNLYSKEKLTTQKL